MKPASKLALTILVVSSAVFAGDTPGIGRYQLFSGPIEILDTAGRSSTTTALFRIDTVTGQTWVLNRSLVKGPKFPDGQFAEGWVKQSEDYQASLFIATFAAKGSSATYSFTNLYSSTNALRTAMEQMYEPPKQRAEYEAIVADPGFQRYIATNRPPESVRPSSKNPEKQ